MPLVVVQMSARYGHCLVERLAFDVEFKVESTVLQAECEIILSVSFIIIIIKKRLI